MPKNRSSRYDDDYRLLLKMLVDGRLLARLSQGEVAIKMGFNQSIVSRLEGGVIRLDIIDLLGYLDAIEMPAAEFLSEFDRRRRTLKAEGTAT